ncbi:MAG: hypothetical protein ETSY1_17995, partial [Candidatus Entotheonella factor]
MGTITWLHLSDIHFRQSQSYGQHIVLQPLIRDIRERCVQGLQPDFIVLTGDIAHASRPEEYDMAKRFLDEVLDATGLEKDRLCLVPGNHDVDRGKNDMIARAMIPALSNRSAVNEFLANNEQRAVIFDRFHHYNQFLHDYLGADVPYDPQSQYYYFKLIEVAKQPIAILGLNSAWLAASNEDRNQLILGERQVREALEASQGAVLRLALMHHPFDWLRDFDRTAVESMLRRQCHFLLHGHMHEVGLLEVRAPSGAAMIIAAGACYETVDYPNSYNVVRLDLKSGQGTIYLRVFSDRNGGFWASDTRSYAEAPNGEFTFPLPDELKGLGSSLPETEGEGPTEAAESSTSSASPSESAPVATKPPDLTGLETQYRKTIIDQFEKLTFRGLAPSGTPISLSLDDVYVELKAVADVPEAADTYSADERRLLLEAEIHGGEAREELAMHLDALRAERWNRQARQETTQLQRRSIQDVLDDRTQRGVVILGDPGSGKTTLMHYQALRAAKLASHAGTTRKPLPIFVPLAAYDDYLRRESLRRSLNDFLAVYYEQWHNMLGLEPLFHRALEEGRALVLLDGLDEVLDTTTRQYVAAQADTLIRQWSSRGNRFALTSRIVGYREAQLQGDLPHVTVLDFGYDEIGIFAHQWCRSYESWLAGEENSTALQRATAEEEALLYDVRSNPSVERLAASPLLLTMLALLRRHVGKLPDRRIELYERYVRTLIDNWETNRSKGARQLSPKRFDPHEAISHLIALSLWLQQNKPSGTARRHELERALETICLRYEGNEPATAPERARVQAQQAGTHFLGDMRHFAGLLAERGRDAFGFLHLTFQEYFAGRALALMSSEARWVAIQPHLHRPRWREPILLCAGQLGVMEQRRAEVTELAQQICHAKSEHEDILHRDLFLATALVAEHVGLAHSILDELASKLEPLQTSSVPTVRDIALAGLSQLARLGSLSALSILQQSLKDRTLQRHVMDSVRAIVGADSLEPIRSAIASKLSDNDNDVR